MESRSNNEKLESKEPNSVTDINAQDQNGMTPLMHAVIKKDLELVKKLIAAGANLNLKEHKHGETALLLAIENFNIDIIHALIHANADINITNNSGNTPLMSLLFKFDHFEDERYFDYILLAKKLIALKHCDLNAKNYIGSTTLTIAVKYCAPYKIIKQLIDSGRCDLDTGSINKNDNSNALLYMIN